MPPSFTLYCETWIYDHLRPKRRFLIEFLREGIWCRAKAGAFISAILTMGHKMQHLKLLSASLLAISFYGPGLASGATAYQITDLGAGTVSAINNLGNIVGYDSNSGFLWKGGVFTPLVPTDGSGYIFAPNDINDLDEIVGDKGSLSGPAAYRWTAGNFSALQPSTNTLAPNSQALKINNNGQIVGSIVMPAYVGGGVLRATTWQGTTFSSDLQWQTLRGTYPSAQSVGTYGIAQNNLGTVIGLSSADVFIFSNNVMSALTVASIDISGIRPTDINDNGIIVGGDYLGRAFVLNGNNIRKLEFAGGTYSNALSVNDAGLVVGIATVNDAIQSGHAFLYDGTEMIDLSLLTPVQNAGWTELTRAIDINNKGQIIGVGVLNGHQRSFLLTPVPEPSASILIVFGLIGLFTVLKFRERNHNFKT